MFHFDKVASQSLNECKAIMDRVYAENPEHWPHGLYPSQHDSLYLVRTKESNAPIGFVGFQRIPDNTGKYTGYYTVGIEKAHRKQGYAKEAISKMLEKEANGLDVKAYIVNTNLPSLSLANSLNVPIHIKYASIDGLKDRIQKRMESRKKRLETTAKDADKANTDVAKAEQKLKELEQKAKDMEHQQQIQSYENKLKQMQDDHAMQNRIRDMESAQRETEAQSEKEKAEVELPDPKEMHLPISLLPQDQKPTMGLRKIPNFYGNRFGNGASLGTMPQRNTAPVATKKATYEPLSFITDPELKDMFKQAGFFDKYKLPLSILAGSGAGYGAGQIAEPLFTNPEVAHANTDMGVLMGGALAGLATKSPTKALAGLAALGGIKELGALGADSLVSQSKATNRLADMVTPTVASLESGAGSFERAMDKANTGSLTQKQWLAVAGALGTLGLGGYALKNYLTDRAKRKREEEEALTPKVQRPKTKNKIKIEIPADASPELLAGLQRDILNNDPNETVLAPDTNIEFFRTMKKAEQWFESEDESLFGKEAGTYDKDITKVINKVKDTASSGDWMDGIKSLAGTAMDVAAPMIGNAIGNVVKPINTLLGNKTYAEHNAGSFRVPADSHGELANIQGVRDYIFQNKQRRLHGARLPSPANLPTVI